MGSELEKKVLSTFASVRDSNQPVHSYGLVTWFVFVNLHVYVIYSSRIIFIFGTVSVKDFMIFLLPGFECDWGSRYLLLQLCLCTSSWTCELLQ